MRLRLRLLVPVILTLALGACGGAATRESESPTPEHQGHHHQHGSAAHDEHSAHHSHARAAEHGEHPGGGGETSRDGVRGHRFGNAEKWSARFDDPDRDAWQKPDEVIAAMKIDEGMVVADIGAGTGYFLPYLSAAVGPSGGVLGLDIEPDMVRFMRERAAEEGLENVEARVVKPDDPGLAAGSVDRILFVNTWHHITDRASYATTLSEALKPGGAVVIVDYNLDSPRGPPPGHRLEAEAVAAELEAAGLETEITEETLPYQHIVIGRRPQGQ